MSAGKEVKIEFVWEQPNGVVPKAVNQFAVVRGVSTFPSSKTRAVELHLGHLFAPIVEPETKIMRIPISHVGSFQLDFTALQQLHSVVTEALEELKE